MHVGINGAAVEDKCVVFQEGIEVSAGEALPGDLPARDIVDLRLPVVLEAEDEAHIIRFASPESRNTGVPQVSQEATAPPGLVDRQMPAIMLPSGADMVAHRRSTADREDFMHLNRRVGSGPGKVSEQGISNRHRRGIDDVPVLHSTQRSRQIDLLRLSIRQGALRQRRHTLLEGRVEPPIERRTRDLWHRKLQVGAQDVCLIGAAWRPRRNDHRPHQHPEVQFALPLDHPALLAQAVYLLLRQHRLEDLAHLVTCHGLSPRYGPSCPVLPMLLRRASRACAGSRVKQRSTAITGDPGLSRHVCVFDYYGMTPSFAVRTLPNWDVVPLIAVIPARCFSPLSFAHATLWGLCLSSRA